MMFCLFLHAEFLVLIQGEGVKLIPFFSCLPLFMQLNMCPCVCVCPKLQTQHVTTEFYFLLAGLQVLFCTICSSDQPLSLCCLYGCFHSRNILWHSAGETARLTPVETFKVMQSIFRLGGLLAIYHAWWASVEETQHNFHTDWIPTSTWGLMGSTFWGNACSRIWPGILPKKPPWVTNILGLQALFHWEEITLENQALQSSEMSNIKLFGHHEFSSILSVSGRHIDYTRLFGECMALQHSGSAKWEQIFVFKKNGERNTKESLWDGRSITDSMNMSYHMSSTVVVCCSDQKNSCCIAKEQ